MILLLPNFLTPVEAVSLDLTPTISKTEATLPGNSAATEQQLAETKVKLNEKASSISIPFIKNNGQLENTDVKFYANIFAGSIFVSQDAITYLIIKEEADEREEKRKKQAPREEAEKKQKAFSLKEKFLDQDGEPISFYPRSRTSSNTKLSFFRGDEEKWKSNIDSYVDISLGEVWSGIEVVSSIRGNNVEKIFNVEPGADPQNISLGFEGADGLKKEIDGKLSINTELGSLAMTKPVAFQIIADKKVDVPVEYVIRGDETYGFLVGEYDRNYRLIIDPLIASTYFGTALGTYTMDIQDMVIGADGKIYLAGFTTSSSYPSTAGVVYPTRIGNYDGVISVLSSDLSTLVASTYLGGSLNDSINSIALDGSDIIAVGYTLSNNFPTTVGAYDTTYDGVTRRQVFITRISQDLTTIGASTYFGKGSTTEDVVSVVIDSNHKIFIGGITNSTTFMTTAGAYDEVHNGGVDFFVSRLDQTLAASPSALEVSTYLGGLSNDYMYDLQIDAGGNVVVVGDSSSTNFPVTAGAYQSTRGDSGSSFVVSKLNNNLTSLSSSTYLAGTDPSGYDEIDGNNSIDFDSSGNVYIVGVSYYGGFPVTTGAYRETFNAAGYSDVFIAKLSADFTALSAATYFGGQTCDNSSYSIDVNTDNKVYVTGYSYPEDESFADIPVTAGAYQTEPSIDGEWYNETFISRFDSSLSTLEASTLVDGNDDDDALIVKVKPDGNIVALLEVDSDDLPTLPGAYSNAVGSGNEYLITLDADLSAPAGPTMHHLEVTGSGSQTAGNSQTITITAYDQDGDPYAGYVGDKTITLSGPSGALDGTSPTCKDKNNVDVAIGTGMVLEFDAGVATCSLKLYRAETVSIDVNDGSYNSSANTDYDLDMSVSPDNISNEESQINVSADPAVVLVPEAVTLIAKDAYRNLLTSGGATVTLAISGINTHNLSVTDNDNGTYTATYTPSCDLGGDEITATVDGLPVGSDSDGTDDGTYELTTQIKITITVKDRDGTEVSYGGDDVNLTISGANSATPTVIDNGDGTYSAFYIPTNSGTDHVSGTLNGRVIGSDMDGNSDGTYDVEICAELVSQIESDEGGNRYAQEDSKKNFVESVGDRIAEISAFLVPTASADTKEETQEKYPEQVKQPIDLSQLVERAVSDELHVPFIKNSGAEVDDRVEYFSKLSFGNFFITDEMMWYDIPFNYAKDEIATAKDQDILLGEEFIDSDSNPIRLNPQGKDGSETTVSIFRGNDSADWQKKAESFGRLDLGEIWDGISVDLLAYNKRVEKVFSVESGADPGDILVRDSGADSLSINDAGQLLIRKGDAEVLMSAPIAYQEAENGIVEPVSVSYYLEDDFSYGFKVGKYDESRTLIIDPWLGGSYLGGAEYEDLADPYSSTGNKIAQDSDGNIFFIGTTESIDFPTTIGAYDTTKADKRGVFISKFNSDLTQLLASTIIEGTTGYTALGDLGQAVDVDPSGNVFILTLSFMEDFPLTAGAYDDTQDYTFGYGNVIISKFNNDLTELLASTTVEGTRDDRAENLTVDSLGNVFVLGQTSATDEGGGFAHSNFPVTAGAYTANHIYEGYPCNNTTFFSGGFLVKFDNDLSDLLASTFFNTAAPSSHQALAINPNGNVMITGQAVVQESIEIYGRQPTPTTAGAYDSDYHYRKAHLSILTPDLENLVASTLFGGTGTTVTTNINSIGVDSNGSIFVTGETNSNDYPTTAGAYDTSHNSGFDVIISKFSSDLTSLEASTYFGTASADYSVSLDIDSDDKIFITGYGGAGILPVIAGSFEDQNQGWQDAFIARFNNDLSEIERDSYIGGMRNDYSASLLIDDNDDVYIAGLTLSSDFPISSYPSLAYDSVYSGGGIYDDTFIAKLDNFLSNDSDPDNTSILVQSCTPEPLGELSPANSSLSVSPAPAEIGNSINITLTAYDTDNDPYIVGGDVVIISVVGVNPNLPAVTDNGDGTYTASYIAVNQGLDQINATINAENVTKDADGTSDGIFNLLIEASLPSDDDEDEKDYLRIEKYSKKSVTFDALISEGNSKSRSVTYFRDGGTGLREIKLEAEKDRTIRGDFEIKKLSKAPISLYLPSEYQAVNCSVYEYLDIDSDFPDSKLEAVSFKFKIKKSWLKEKMINKVAVLSSNTKKAKVRKTKKVENQDKDITLSFAADKLSGWWTIIGCAAEEIPRIQTGPINETEPEAPPIASVEENDFEPVKVTQDIDQDGKLEEAIDTDRNINNGYEAFSDPDNSTRLVVTADGDYDAKPDFFVTREGENRPDIYWDPDTLKFSPITLADIDSDGSDEYLFDADHDQANDHYYDPETRMIKGIMIEKITPLEERLRELIQKYQTPLTITIIVGALLPLLSIIGRLGNLTDLPLLFKEGFFRLFGLLLWRKKRKRDWGVVYDIKTGKPIPLARVDVIDEVTGKLKESKLADKYGSYYFLVAPGVYQLEVSRVGFQTPDISQSSNWKTFYQHSYTGEKLTFQEADKLAFDLPLEAVSAKTEKFFTGKIAVTLFALLFWLGLPFNLVICLFYPQPINFFILFIYLYIAFLKDLALSDPKWGTVIDTQSISQPFATVKLHEKEHNQLVTRTIADEAGRYFLVANRGNYALNVTTVGEAGRSSETAIILSERSSVHETVVL